MTINNLFQYQVAIFNEMQLKGIQIDRFSNLQPMPYLLIPVCFNIFYIKVFLCRRKIAKP